MNARDAAVLHKVNRKIYEAFADFNITITPEEIRRAALAACEEVWPDFGEVR